MAVEGQYSLHFYRSPRLSGIPGIRIAYGEINSLPMKSQYDSFEILPEDK
jgi:hypothetical protein